MSMACVQVVQSVDESDEEDGKRKGKFEVRKAVVFGTSPVALSDGPRLARGEVTKQ